MQDAKETVLMQKSSLSSSQNHFTPFHGHGNGANMGESRSEWAVGSLQGPIWAFLGFAQGYLAIDLPQLVHHVDKNNLSVKI